MGKELIVTHQIRDAETYKVLHYDIEDKYTTFQATPKQLLEYVREGSVLNAGLFEDSVLYFKLRHTEGVNFIKYHYSDNLKQKLEANYTKWYEEQARRQAMDLKDNVEYSFVKKDGLYKLTSARLKGDITEITMPSFIADVEKSNMYTGNVFFFDTDSTTNEILTKSITSVFVDKYTNGLCGEMVNYLHDRIELCGLMPVLEPTMLSRSYAQFLRSDINMDKFVTQLNILGKVRYVGERVFDTVSYHLNITAGRHLRVLFVPSITNSLSCYDTTLLIGNTDSVKPIIFRNTKRTNKEVLLKFKDSVEDMILEYNHDIVYDIKDDRVDVKFKTQECFNDFYTCMQAKGDIKDGLVLSYYPKDFLEKYTNADNLYWKLKSQVKNRIITKAYEYAFAETI